MFGIGIDTIKDFKRAIMKKIKGLANFDQHRESKPNVHAPRMKQAKKISKTMHLRNSFWHIQF